MLEQQNISLEKLRIITTITLIGFIIAVFFHNFIGYFGFGYPFDSFLFKPSDRFMDFFNVFDISKDLNPYFSGKVASNYFPLAYLIFYPVTLLGDDVLALILLYFLFFYFICWYVNFNLKNIKKIISAKDYIQQILILCFLSYPILFCLDRGNIDFFLFIMTALSIIFFIDKRYIISAIVLSIPAGMKLYPFVFLALFIKNKRYFEGALCIGMALTLNVIALSCFEGGIYENIQKMFLILNGAVKAYVINDLGLPFSISLFSCFKVLYHYYYMFKTSMFAGVEYRYFIQMCLPYYTFLAFVIFTIIFLYIYFIEKIIWKQIMLLTLAMILLPVISGDYKLIFIYIPLLLYIGSDNSDKFSKYYSILFGLLLIPKNYFNLPYTDSISLFKGAANTWGIEFNGGYSVMSLFNICILSIFIILIMTSGIKDFQSSSKLEDMPDDAKKDGMSFNEASY